MRSIRWGAIGCAFLLAVILAVQRQGAAAPIVITPGVGIGPLILGMRAVDIPRVLGLTITPGLDGNRVVYDVPKMGLTSWASDERVVQVRTVNPLHRTPGGVRPGQEWSDEVLSLCSGMALATEIAGGVEIDCPFVGIKFEVIDGKIVSISVSRAVHR